VDTINFHSIAIKCVWILEGVIGEAGTKYAVGTEGSRRDRICREALC